MAERHRILLNVDCWDLYRGRVSLDRAGLRAHLEAICRGGVSDVLLNVNAQKAFYPSDVWERAWDGIEQTADGTWRSGSVELEKEPVQALRCRLLHERVPDAEQFYIDHGRTLGRRVHLSMRMNDLHDVGNSRSDSLSTFWREHPEYRRAPFYSSAHWYSQALDYAIPAVRERAMRLVEEILGRFDCDGFELDWMRHPFSLRPGMEAEGAVLLTGFMRNVRRLADAAASRTGRPVEVSVRVPARPEDARRTGYDVVMWSRENLVDRVIPTSIHPTTDHDMPLELWKLLLAPRTRLAAGLEFRADSRANWWGKNPLVATSEIFFGHVASCLYRGADEIYLYNFFNPALFGDAEWLTMMNHGDRRADAEAQTRRHIVTYCDSRAPGMGTDGVDAPLPLRPTWNGQFEPVRLNVGGATAGRRASVVLGFAADDGTPPPAPHCQVRLNGGPALAPIAPPPIPYPPYVSTPAAFAIAPGMLHDGDNVIDIGAAADSPMVVNWCEIRTEASTSAMPAARESAPPNASENTG